MSEQRQILKGSAVFAAMTLISRVSGYLRDLVRAIYLGTSNASDAFGVAIMIPNLLRRFVGEGAMAAALVPVLSDLKRKERKEWLEYLGSFFTLLSAVLVLLTVAGILLSPWLVPSFFARGFSSNPQKIQLTIRLTQFAFLYLFFIGLAAFVQGILNTFKVFGPSAFTPVLLNLSIIASAILVSPFIDQPAYAFVGGFVVGGALQLFFQLPYLKKIGVKIVPMFKWGSKNVLRTLKLMVPALFGFGIYEINIALSQMIASYLGEGAISSLQYSIRLMELPLGVFVAAVSTVILPTLSEKGHAGQMAEYRQHLLFAIRLVLFLTLPALAFMYPMRRHIFSVLFGYGAFGARSIELTSFAFSFHVLGLPLVGLSRVLVPAFYALEDTKTPVIAAFWTMLLNVALCALFAYATDLGNGGIALAATLSALLQVILLIRFMKSRRSVVLLQRELLIPVLRVVLAALVLFGASWLLASRVEYGNRMMSGIALVIGAVGALVVYMGSLWAVKADEAVFLVSRFLNRISKK